MAGLVGLGARNPDRTVGDREFRNKDAAQYWSDGGAGDQMVQALEQQIAAALHQVKAQLRDYAGRQAFEAVAEYVSAGEFMVIDVQGQPCVAFRVGDPGEPGMISYVSLESLLSDAVEDATKANDQDAVASLRRLGQLLAPQPVQQKLDHEPLRNGIIQGGSAVQLPQFAMPVGRTAGRVQR